MFFFMYVIRIHESVDTLLIRRYNTLLTSFATFVRRNLYKTIKLPGFSKNSYLKKRVYSVHFDTGRKLIRCRCRIRCWGQKQGNSCYLVLIRNPSIVAAVVNCKVALDHLVMSLASRVRLSIDGHD